MAFDWATSSLSYSENATGTPPKIAAAWLWFMPKRPRKALISSPISYTRRAGVADLTALPLAERDSVHALIIVFRSGWSLQATDKLIRYRKPLKP